jgi:hypothetical protein
MPLYYLHIVDGTEVIRDEEGADFDSLASAEAEARASANDLSIQSLREGTVDRTRSIEVVDESGKRCAVFPVLYRMN